MQKPPLEDNTTKKVIHIVPKPAGKEPGTSGGYDGPLNDPLFYVVIAIIVILFGISVWWTWSGFIGGIS